MRDEDIPLKHYMSEQIGVLCAPIMAFGVITRPSCSLLSAILVNGCLCFHFFHYVIGWKSFNRLRCPLLGLPLPLLLVPGGWCVLAHLRAEKDYLPSALYFHRSFNYSGVAALLELTKRPNWSSKAALCPRLSGLLHQPSATYFMM